LLETNVSNSYFTPIYSANQVFDVLQRLQPLDSWGQAETAARSGRLTSPNPAADAPAATIFNAAFWSLLQVQPHSGQWYCLAAGKPLVYLLYRCASFRRRLLQNVNKLSKAQVAYLASPQSFHAIQVQALQADQVKTMTQGVSQLPMSVSPLVGDSLMPLCQPPLCLSAIVGTRLLAA
jgi:hypothetical protein